MRNHRSQLIALLLASVVLAGVVWAAVACAMAADAAAVGVVAAASRGDDVELSSRFGRSVTSAETRDLTEEVPAGLSDPHCFGVTRWGVDLPFNVTAEVATADAPGGPVGVVMAWDWGMLDWRVISVARISEGSASRAHLTSASS